MRIHEGLQSTVLETERLLLKELNAANMEYLYTQCSDEEIMEYLGFRTIEELNADRDRFKGGFSSYRFSFVFFTMVEKASGIAIGRCGYHSWYMDHKRAEIGYGLYDDAHKRKGYMTEAIKHIIAYGFEEMELNRVEAMLSKANTPSLKIITGLGFTEEGTMREHYMKNGRIEDSIVFHYCAESTMY